MARVMVISDTQVPFHHKDTIKFLQEVWDAYECDTAVHIGDEVDFHALSDYDKDPDGWSAGNELKKAIKELQPFYELWPKMKVCISNHTLRPFRKAYRHGIPKAFLKDFKEFLEAPEGWEWKDRWDIDGVRYQHGHGYSGKYGHMNAAHNNGKPTVIGHIHFHGGGPSYFSSSEQLLWGMNVGCLIDKKAYAFAYSKPFRFRPILGCGVVENGQGLFQPMWLKKNGRWNGKLEP